MHSYSHGPGHLLYNRLANELLVLALPLIWNKASCIFMSQHRSAKTYVVLAMVLVVCLTFTYLVHMCLTHVCELLWAGWAIASIDQFGEKGSSTATGS